MTAQPNYAVPTGEFIQEWLEENGINAAELSRRLGVSRKHVSELLRGKVTLSHELAIGLENVTGVPARRWNQLEALYQEDRARLAVDAVLTGQHARATAFPLSYLRRLGFIDAPARDKAGTVRQLARFFKVADLDAWDHSWAQSAVAYRKAATRSACSEHLATWLTVGERWVDLDDLPPFDAARLEALLLPLRALSLEPRDAPERARAMLATVGVALCYVPPVPGLGAYGATRWLQGRPIVQLSLRGKSDDQLWFTVFHELGHVLLHPHSGLYVNTDEDSAEHEANQFAADLLIPPGAAEALPRNRSKAAVREIARQIGVSPGVVLGRVQRLTGDYAWGHDLKVKYEFGADHHG
ncbi:ImmA/IrrE family metallo-endopeptidase [Cellulosimicrobium sp. CpK407]|uniref:ImmA/IrrE family metallo-endopeptidase n=1 Tax=Cellulosimicrobium sp. CpK407 TaxID=3229847 RepID=UPI003F35B500